jgi:DNA mismatch repair protein MutS
MAAAKSTPVMEQHARAKRAHPDAVLFFRLGDFYEMFGEDAVLCARVLNLTLTSRNKGKPDEIPMAGVPHHAAHSYIGRMLEAGYRIAVCEQMADPKTVKGIVPREVVRVLTPGLITHDDHLRARENNWLAAVESGRSGTAVALLDISTGELRVALLADPSSAIAELVHAAPREVLLAEDGDEALRAALSAAGGGVRLRTDPPLTDDGATEALAELEPDARDLQPAERLAVGRALRFARTCTPGVELPVRAIGRWDPSSSMVIDPTAQRHLELIESNVGDAAATLLSVLDVTRTPPGGRLLRRRLLAPLTDVAEIRRRHDAVEAFVVHANVRELVQTELRNVSDLERLLSRVVLGEASPKDLGATRDGLLACALVVALLQSLELEYQSVLDLAPDEDVVVDVASALDSALVERPPGIAKEGAVFNPGYDAELSEWSEVRQRGSELIVALESRLREETGIPTLRAKFTRVFGWYLEVSRTYVSKVPKEWRRKQTVATGERYTLDELDEVAERIASAEERHRSRELELLRILCDDVREAAERIRSLCVKVSAWDVAAALAEVAHKSDFVRPAVDDSTVTRIEEGRHPVVERLAASGRFVPNDVDLDAEGVRLWIVTGPNMAGKSTFLRQVALITILAQMGSFVPAKSATLGIADRVLSRVGASDNLARGESTFMVEMRETADILRHATPRSIVILDEIGRGTSTFDGLAIAWAVAEHLEEIGRCRALFATHYHELTTLGEQSAHVDNYSVSARERDGDIVFLHRLVHGAANQSYGVQVAKLAGLPEIVLARASALLASFEGHAVENRGAPTPPKAGRKQNLNQLDLFAAAPVQAPAGAEAEQALSLLRAVDLERLSPLDALQFLAKLKKLV